MYINPKSKAYPPISQLCRYRAPKTMLCVCGGGGGGSLAGKEDTEERTYDGQSSSDRMSEE